MISILEQFENSMMDIVSVLLDQLFEQLRLVNSPVKGALQEGISRTVIDKYFTENGLKSMITPETYLLYEWKNGLKEEFVNSMSIGELQLFTLAIFPDLVSSLSVFRQSVVPFR